MATVVVACLTAHPPMNHANPIKTPYGFSTTADEIVAGLDLHGMRMIVTGASSGIGVDTARAVAAAGAEVHLAVRSVVAGERVAAAIRAATPDAKLVVRPLDLSSQASVRRFASDWEGPLHVLVNNAGVMALPSLERTPEGWEMQYATNFLGHFTLTLALHRALAAADGARVVSVSSSAHLLSPVVFDDPHFNFLPYEPLAAYGQSKTAGILLAVEATRRWAADGIVANALHPGAIRTNLQKHVPGVMSAASAVKTTAQGAATSVLLAVSPLLRGIGGRYFEDCNEADLVEARTPDYRGLAPYAVDPENADRLWQASMAMVRAAH